MELEIFLFIMNQYLHVCLLVGTYQVGSRYLDHLILERHYDKAAELCPKLLRGSAPAWERLVLGIIP